MAHTRSVGQKSRHGMTGFSAQGLSEPVNRAPFSRGPWARLLSAKGRGRRQFLLVMGLRYPFPCRPSLRVYSAASGHLHFLPHLPILPTSHLQSQQWRSSLGSNAFHGLQLILKKRPVPLKIISLSYGQLFRILIACSILFRETPTFMFD